MLDLWIKNYFTTDAKVKFRDFRSAYTFNTQYDVSIIFFVIVKTVQPETRAGWSDSKSKLENIKMSCLKHDIPKANMHIVEWMNEISITGETYL